jgi:exodeoxyribonuclease V alpha subunit
VTIPGQASLVHKVVVRSILSVASNGGAIFSGYTESGEMLRVLASGDALDRLPVRGESWAVHGKLRKHELYGAQLHASACRYELPKGRLLVRYLADHPEFSGIGETKAIKLWNTYGDKLFEILNTGDVSSLRSVVGQTVADRIIQVWAEKRVDANLIEYLDKRGFDWRLATKLIRVWGGQAISMLEKNPYYLLAFSSWPKVDAAAIKLGIQFDDPRRLVGAVEAILYERLQEAHTLISHVDLVGAVQDRLKTKDGPRAITCALEEGAIVGDIQNGYQPVGAAALEKGIAARLRRMISGDALKQDAVTSVVADDNWADPQIHCVEEEQGFLLEPEQRQAVVMPFQHGFSVLTGGAGVGKTTVLRVIMHLAQQLGMPVIQMALAGRAAKRMEEATKHPAMTIAKFLLHEGGTLVVKPNTLIIIDEASMLDLPTLYRVLRHLPDDTRMLLVGDAAQLPPIGFGLVFHRLIDNQNVPQTHLVKAHRQAASTGIPAAASAVRQHQLPSFIPFTGAHPGVSFIECKSERVRSELHRITATWRGDDYQVLAAVKSGVSGIDAINDDFHREACTGNGDDGGFVAGEPVIHLINDYERGLMNGTLGKVVSTSDDGQVSIDFDGDQHSFTTTEVYGRLELAYAISVHKAQGSQFKRVVVVVSQNRLLDHALIYTALTRGAEQVVFIGDRDAFQEAVLSAPFAQHRTVAFSV